MQRVRALSLSLSFRPSLPPSFAILMANSPKRLKILRHPTTLRLPRQRCQIRWSFVQNAANEMSTNNHKWQHGKQDITSASGPRRWVPSLPPPISLCSPLRSFPATLSQPRLLSALWGALSRAQRACTMPFSPSFFLLSSLVHPFAVLLGSRLLSLSLFSRVFNVLRQFDSQPANTPPLAKPK